MRFNLTTALLALFWFVVPCEATTSDQDLLLFGGIKVAASVVFNSTNPGTGVNCNPWTSCIN